MVLSWEYLLFHRIAPVGLSKVKKKLGFFSRCFDSEYDTKCNRSSHQGVILWGDFMRDFFNEVGSGRGIGEEEILTLKEL